MNRYLVVIEKAKNNYGAYLPDIPGCVAMGDTVEETLELSREALDSHLSAMAEDGDPIPQPTTTAEYVEVKLPQVAKGAKA